ncbi:hypothetical protein V8D89_015209 [Ganoderma adspersum]
MASTSPVEDPGADSRCSATVPSRTGGGSGRNEGRRDVFWEILGRPGSHGTTRTRRAMQRGRPDSSRSAKIPKILPTARRGQHDIRSHSPEKHWPYARQRTGHADDAEHLARPRASSLQGVSGHSDGGLHPFRRSADAKTQTGECQSPIKTPSLNVSLQTVRPSLSAILKPAGQDRAQGISTPRPAGPSRSANRERDKPVSTSTRREDSTWRGGARRNYGCDGQPCGYKNGDGSDRGRGVEKTGPDLMHSCVDLMLLANRNSPPTVSDALQISLVSAAQGFGYVTRRRGSGPCDEARAPSSQFRNTAKGERAYEPEGPGIKPAAWLAPAKRGDGELGATPAFNVFAGNEDPPPRAADGIRGWNTGTEMWG